MRALLDLIDRDGVSWSRIKPLRRAKAIAIFVTTGCILTNGAAGMSHAVSMTTSLPGANEPILRRQREARGSVQKAAIAHKGVRYKAFRHLQVARRGGQNAFASNACAGQKEPIVSATPKIVPWNGGRERILWEPRGVQTRLRRVSMLKEARGNGTVTRQALCAAVYDRCPQLSRAKARELVDATFEELSQALIRGEPVKLRSFGTFVSRAKRERIGRNPKTGVEATICARRVISFHPSPILVARLNGEPPGEAGD